VGAVALSACGSSSSDGPLKAPAIIQADAATKVVHLELAANETASFSGFNFDGYGGGAMRVSVPVGWTVDVTCKNDSTTMAHSCAIVDDAPITTSGGTIAFRGASIPNPVNGLGLGVSASFQFIASKIGTYRIDCLVIGHEADGMWDWFNVTPSGLPSVHT
jgi:Sulfocyanin (SoxE) domain